DDQASLRAPHVPLGGGRRCRAHHEPPVLAWEDPVPAVTAGAAAGVLEVAPEVVPALLAVAALVVAAVCCAATATPVNPAVAARLAATSARVVQRARRRPRL
ncbi:MAG: hypothetical protein ACXVXQ_11260, partial [Mycobacteriaceae bacterium]